MDGTNKPKETTRVTAPAPVASNTPAVSKLSVNVFTAPGKAMVGERPKPFGEASGASIVNRYGRDLGKEYLRVAARLRPAANPPDHQA